jgi:hypothetical protein
MPIYVQKKLQKSPIKAHKKGKKATPPVRKVPYEKVSIEKESMRYIHIN